MDIRIHNRINEIPEGSWNSLVKDNNPFLRHQFLDALEATGCLGEKFGWMPIHVAIYEGDVLQAAMPLYSKTNSYGEFVFDHAWADAYKRSGLAYYPKLVNAVPYTPAAGQRLLARTGEEGRLLPILLQTAIRLAGQQQASGFHCLFPDAENQVFLDQQSLMVRHDCQFHWKNRNYADFEDFLSALKSRKRKAIRQERRRVRESGVTIRCLDGNSASSQDWRDFSKFYQQIFEEKWGIATLNEEFFRRVAAAMPEQILLILVDQGGVCIAGSLMFCSDTSLYGRFWGSIKHVDKLHFEACYYQGIEFCIARGLRWFEPGAQGEHKVPRGFLPSLTRSYHWLSGNALTGPISDYVAHERTAVGEYMQQMTESSPYRTENR